MSLIVAGTIRVPPENVGALLPHMLTMMTATRAEDGCDVCAYAQDVAEPSLIRVFEIWRDKAALDAHFATAHMADWRAAGASLGVSDRSITAYDIASQRGL